MRKQILILSIGLASLTLGNQYNAQGGSEMKLSTSAFGNGEEIPAKFCCQGQSINPALVIENIPEGTKSLVLILDDPDAPGGMFVHWLMYDIPVTSRIEEDSAPGKQGINDYGKINYGPPCAPAFGNKHRYFFKIYALDRILGLKEGIDKPALESAIEGRVLAKAELIGLFKRK